MPDWPSTLPQAFEAGMQMYNPTGFVKSPTDIGPPISYRRYTDVPDYLFGTMLLRDDQANTLRNFYKNEVSEGADRFMFPDPINFQMRSARFNSTIEWTAIVGGPRGVSLWRCSFELELLVR